MKKHKYLERIKTYTIEEYVSHILEIRIKCPESMSEIRKRAYKVFFPTIYTIPTCNGCKLKASFVAYELQTHGKHTTYNIYGVDSNKEEVMFTIDHILSQGEGGSRRALSNLQVLCYQCNENKGKEESRRCEWKRKKNKNETKIQ